MITVTVSSRYQITIPKKIREELGIRPGQKLQVLAISGCIELMPIEPIEKFRGILKGMPTERTREEDRF
jgi:AbrB family looped-hinge helix DNA binding protein